jgi:hypothetical protein
MIAGWLVGTLLKYIEEAAVMIPDIAEIVLMKKPLIMRYNSGILFT